jgi:hypothetical protein
MSRYIAVCILTSAEFLFQSQAFAITCNPPLREICFKKSCSCWDVRSIVTPDGKTLLELKGEPEQAPSVLKRLNISPKDILK